MTKKLYKIIILTLIFYLNFFNLFAKNTSFTVNNIYSGKFTYAFKDYEFPPGDWILYTKNSMGIPHTGLQLKCIEFAQIENNSIKALFDVCDLTTGGKWTPIIAGYLAHLYKKDKYDNCTLRPEYYYTKLISKGTLTNCFKFRHVDPNKELYFPDDPESNEFAAAKKYFKDRNLNLPKTMIGSMHTFYAISVKDKLVEISYFIDPEFFGAPKTKNGDETMSEYHRNNIDNFPIKKEFMNEWLIKRIKFHKEFEKKMKAKKHQMIDFGVHNNLGNTQSNNSSISTQLENLNDLYKSGALTKEEFEKAKKRILD